MEVHGDEVVATRCHQHIGDEFCGNGSPAFVLLVLSGVWVARDDCGYPTSGGGPTSGDEDEEFHKIIVDVEAARLYDEDVFVPNTLGDLDVDFAVGEALDVAWHKRLVQPITIQYWMEESVASCELSMIITDREASATLTGLLWHSQDQYGCFLSTKSDCRVNLCVKVPISHRTHPSEVLSSSRYAYRLEEFLGAERSTSGKSGTQFIPRSINKPTQSRNATSPSWYHSPRPWDRYVHVNLSCIYVLNVLHA